MLWLFHHSFYRKERKKERQGNERKRARGREGRKELSGRKFIESSVNQCFVGRKSCHLKIA